MFYNLIDHLGHKESIEIINTNQESILKALPEKYHTNFLIRISREKQKIYATPLSMGIGCVPPRRNSVTELMYLK